MKQTKKKNKTSVEVMLCIGGRMPQRKSEESACYDCYVRDYEVVYNGPNPGETMVIYYLGFVAKPPKGYRVVIHPKAGLSNTGFVCQEPPGQGDRDYKSEYQFRLCNIKRVGISIPYINDREASCCQMSIERVIDFDIVNMEAGGDKQNKKNQQ